MLGALFGVTQGSALENTKIYFSLTTRNSKKHIDHGPEEAAVCSCVRGDPAQ
jgi:hypothetical protein